MILNQLPLVIDLSNKKILLVKKIKKKIEKVGGRCDLHWYKDAKHGFFNAMFKETMQEVDKFLVSLGYLEGPSTLQ